MARKPLDGAPDGPPDAVGYCRPPTTHRIRKGQVRNPWGRRGKPKAPLPFMEQLVEIRVDGVARKLTRLQALEQALFASAMKGDVRAARMILELDRRRVSDSPAAATELSVEEEAAFARYVQRQTGRTKEGGV